MCRPAHGFSVNKKNCRSAQAVLKMSHGASIDHGSCRVLQKVLPLIMARAERQCSLNISKVSKVSSFGDLIGCGVGCLFVYLFACLFVCLFVCLVGCFSNACRACERGEAKLRGRT